jgi:hypothetical protein
LIRSCFRSELLKLFSLFLRRIGGVQRQAEVIANVFESSVIVMLLRQDYSQQILQLGNLVLSVDLQAPKGALLSGIEMLEMKVSRCIN